MGWLDTGLAHRPFAPEFEKCGKCAHCAPILICNPALLQCHENTRCWEPGKFQEDRADQATSAIGYRAADKDCRLEVSERMLGGWPGVSVELAENRCATCALQRRTLEELECVVKFRPCQYGPKHPERVFAPTLLLLVPICVVAQCPATQSKAWRLCAESSDLERAAKFRTIIDARQRVECFCGRGLRSWLGNEGQLLRATLDNWCCPKAPRALTSHRIPRNRQREMHLVQKSSAPNSVASAEGFKPIKAHLV